MAAPGKRARSAKASAKGAKDAGPKKAKKGAKASSKKEVKKPPPKRAAAKKGGKKASSKASSKKEEMTDEEEEVKAPPKKRGKAAAKKASTKKASTKKASTKKASAKKASTKKTSTKKASAKKAPSKRASKKEEKEEEEEEEEVKAKPAKKEAKAKEPSPDLSAAANALAIGDTYDAGEYTVTRTPSGHYSCNCKGFAFKKGKPDSKVCKHIEELGVTAKVQKAAGVHAKVSAKGASKRPKIGSLDGEKKEELSNMRLDDLKALLRLNAQVVGGTKPELLKRIFDCVEYGCLPKCPTCGGGRMKSEGVLFRCPGFMEDTDFQHCGFTCDYTKLEFPVWVWS